MYKLNKSSYLYECDTIFKVKSMDELFLLTVMLSILDCT